MKIKITIASLYAYDRIFLKCFSSMFLKLIKNIVTKIQIREMTNIIVQKSYYIKS